MIRDLFDT